MPGLSMENPRRKRGQLISLRSEPKTVFSSVENPLGETRSTDCATKGTEAVFSHDSVRENGYVFTRVESLEISHLFQVRNSDCQFNGSNG